MSVIDDILDANKKFSYNFRLADYSHKPQRKVAVVACMDTRIPVAEILGLKTGEANILRNAGAIVTEDVIRSLIVSHQKLGSEEIMIISHSECGGASFKNEEFVAELVDKTGTAAVSPQHFLDIGNMEEHTRRQVLKVRSHPWISDSVVVRGFIYNVKTGLLNEVDV